MELEAGTVSELLLFAALAPPLFLLVYPYVRVWLLLRDPLYHEAIELVEKRFFSCYNELWWRGYRDTIDIFRANMARAVYKCLKKPSRPWNECLWELLAYTGVTFDEKVTYRKMLSTMSELCGDAFEKLKSDVEQRRANRSSEVVKP
ncbi:hypothetical protein Pogu_2110 [Pyrobaculum oguniense TE7]|uniref:Uncharacterized protein n=1 Tax=Pyrobaculum oguniense (strain DSM 13380 / JCM 10595 / TE7) TaxID=698757 RepID=H6QCU1_PYROT|nr:hypothetical protein Pogu_2110 [Pyrobaculum oguniense TE7]